MLIYADSEYAKYDIRRSGVDKNLQSLIKREDINDGLSSESFRRKWSSRKCRAEVYVAHWRMYESPQWYIRIWICLNDIFIFAHIGHRYSAIHRKVLNEGFWSFPELILSDDLACMSEMSLSLGGRAYNCKQRFLVYVCLLLTSVYSLPLTPSIRICPTNVLFKSWPMLCLI